MSPEKILLGHVCGKGIRKCVCPCRSGLTVHGGRDITHAGRMSNKLYIFDCLSKKLRMADAPFMTIGRGQGNVFRCMMRAESGGSFAMREGMCRFFPHSTISSYSLNGQNLQQEAEVRPGMLNLLVLAGGCFVVWNGDESQLPDFGSFDPDEWYAYDKTTGQWSAVMRLRDLARIPVDLVDKTLVLFKGISSCAFELRDILDVVRFVMEESGEIPKSSRPATTPATAAWMEGKEDKEICCPHCWQRFPLSHAMAISSHPKLMGDNILGKSASRRFTPVNVDQQGVPVDAMGLSVREYACPWCHHMLPPFFESSRQMIFPLVGMVNAGKTYYLTTMLHELEYALSREFGIAFRDADSSGNAPLNSMRVKLFNASGPQDAYLEPTTAESALYHDVWKRGQYVRAPRPFVYNLSRSKKTYTMVVYDTAGSSYDPDNGEHELATGHLEAASAILFLFDPTVDIAFSKVIKSSKDTKRLGRQPRQERQALMLSEMEMRLRAALRLRPEKKLDVPLAVIIGKSDTWQELLGAEPLLPSVRSGQFQPKFADVNSKRLRELLFSISPNICMNAEAISTNVHYFAVSSFGGAPELFTDDRGQIHLAPPDGVVHPNRVIDPILWALHCKEPNLLRKTSF